MCHTVMFTLVLLNWLYNLHCGVKIISIVVNVLLLFVILLIYIVSIIDSVLCAFEDWYTAEHINH